MRFSSLSFFDEFMLVIKKRNNYVYLPKTNTSTMTYETAVNDRKCDLLTNVTKSNQTEHFLQQLSCHDHLKYVSRCEGTLLCVIQIKLQLKAGYLYLA